MLFVRITWRANFCARKFISFEAFEQEKIPNDVEVSVWRARSNPAAAMSRASLQVAARSEPPSRTYGVVKRPFGMRIVRLPRVGVKPKDSMVSTNAGVKVR
jgi:hypothetical protein